MINTYILNSILQNNFPKYLSCATLIQRHSNSIKMCEDLIKSNFSFTSLSPVEASIKLNTPFGVPRSWSPTSDLLLTQHKYLLGYNPKLHIPMFVNYRMAVSDYENTVKRYDCFRRDIRLTESEASLCTDYSRSGYNRGHLAPNGKKELFHI